MPDPIHLVPLDAIDARALARDRARLDEDALLELRHSILATGLRMPIELFALAAPAPDLFAPPDPSPHRYGLISGFRRLAAFRSLAADGLEAFATIPAFLRTPSSVTEAMTAMVEENAIRADISPWEQAMVAVRATEAALFPTTESAVDALFARFSRDKRKRIRAVAHLAEDLYGSLTAPESLSLRQLLRLAAAASRGYGQLMRHALLHSPEKQPEAQWRLLLPILAECEDPTIPDPRPEAGPDDRPRRLYELPHHGLRIRRERLANGWALRFTGPNAQGSLIDDIMDEIERMFSRR